MGEWQVGGLAKLQDYICKVRLLLVHIQYLHRFQVVRPAALLVSCSTH